jgi:tetratricopeptide (TPR) repeat protein
MTNQIALKKNALGLILFLLLALPGYGIAEPVNTQDINQNKIAIENLDKPLYNPFIERYVLDELKNLRIDLQGQRTDFTVSNIFYIIATAASILALVGWSSVREIRHKLNEVIEDKVARISEDYEQRLQALESSLKDRTNRIIAAQEDITRTNSMHSLWMRAGLEATHQAKIDVYDQILRINPDDTEALTYKADEVLEMGEPQWALNLCNKALLIDEEYPYAFYQRACANSTLNQLDAALSDLSNAIELSATYLDEAKTDKSLDNLRASGKFDELLERCENT